MAKKIWNITIMMMIAMCMGLTSCSSDNDKKDEPNGGDDSSIESLLLGKWKTTSSDGGYFQMDFRSNGKCYCEERVSNYDKETWMSYYSVSGSEVTLYDDTYD
ncbi:MAG: hypothetical protein K2M98_02340, partial [Muribaculum sp.]|nr:hypothetical protein [Muribaculum sp.]